MLAPRGPSYFQLVRVPGTVSPTYPICQRTFARWTHSLHYFQFTRVRNNRTIIRPLFWNTTIIYFFMVAVHHSIGRSRKLWVVVSYVS